MLCKVMVFNDLLVVSKPAPTGLLGASGPVVITGAAEDPKYHVKLACHMMTPQIISSETAGEGDEAQTTFELSCCTPTKLPPYMVETRVKLSAAPSVAKEFEKHFEAGKRHMVDNLVAITDEYCSSVQTYAPAALGDGPCAALRCPSSLSMVTRVILFCERQDLLPLTLVY